MKRCANPDCSALFQPAKHSGNHQRFCTPVCAKSYHNREYNKQRQGARREERLQWQQEREAAREKAKQEAQRRQQEAQDRRGKPLTPEKVAKLKSLLFLPVGPPPLVTLAPLRPQEAFCDEESEVHTLQGHYGKMPLQRGAVTCSGCRRVLTEGVPCRCGYREGEA